MVSNDAHTAQRIGNEVGQAVRPRDGAGQELAAAREQLAQFFAVKGGQHENS